MRRFNEPEKVRHYATELVHMQVRAQRRMRVGGAMHRCRKEKAAAMTAAKTALESLTGAQTTMSHCWADKNAMFAIAHIVNQAQAKSEDACAGSK